MTTTSVTTKRRLLRRQTNADAVRARRKDLGLTQVEVATQAGITQEHLSAIELGKSNGSHEVISAIAEVLGWSVEEMRLAS